MNIPFLYIYIVKYSHFSFTENCSFQKSKICKVSTFLKNIWFVLKLPRNLQLQYFKFFTLIINQYYILYCWMVEPLPIMFSLKCQVSHLGQARHHTQHIVAQRQGHSMNLGEGHRFTNFKKCLHSTKTFQSFLQVYDLIIDIISHIISLKKLRNSLHKSLKIVVRKVGPIFT